MIERPIEPVFDRLVDMPGYTDWMSTKGLFIDCHLLTDGEVREGTAYLDRTRLGTVRGEVATLTRPTEVVFHYWFRLLGCTIMEGWPGYTLERQGRTSTRLRHVAAGRLCGVFRVFRPLVQRIANSERRRTVDALKASFESHKKEGHR